MLLALTAVPLMAFGAWLIATAGGSLPQVSWLFGSMSIGAGLIDAFFTTLMVWRIGTSVPRVLLVHSAGLTFVGLAAWLLLLRGG